MTPSFPVETRERLDSLLRRFRSLACPAPYAYDWVHHHDGGQNPMHVVFGVVIHGNEFGSLPAAVRLVEALTSGELTHGGRVSIFVGNPEAARANQRYLEVDLNRRFLDTGENHHEDRRAQQLMPILDSADVFIDFHQTILETRQPFYIFPWHKPGWQWARALQSTEVWVTRDPRLQFSANTRCSDEYVAQTGRPGLTVELSQKGFSDAAEALCMETMLRALRHAEDISSGGVSVTDIAERERELTFYQTTYTHRFDDPALALEPGLINFQAVQAGQALSAPDSPEIRVPTDGALLFPKYPERADGQAVSPLPGEIYRLITPLTEHPCRLWEDPDAEPETEG